MTWRYFVKLNAADDMDGGINEGWFNEKHGKLVLGQRYMIDMPTRISCTGFLGSRAPHVFFLLTPLIRDYPRLLCNLRDGIPPNFLFSYSKELSLGNQPLETQRWIRWPQFLGNWLAGSGGAVSNTQLLTVMGGRN